MALRIRISIWNFACIILDRSIFPKWWIWTENSLKMAKRLSRQPLLLQLFVQFRENRPTKDYSCKISDLNSNSKCYFIIDYEMVALNPPLNRRSSLLVSKKLKVVLREAHSRYLKIWCFCLQNCDLSPHKLS